MWPGLLVDCACTTRKLGTENIIPNRDPAHLDTINSCLLLINNNSVYISTENDSNSCLVLPLDRFAKIHNSSANT